MDKVATISLAAHEMAQERNYRRFACLVIGWAVTVLAFLVALKIKK